MGVENLMSFVKPATSITHIKNINLANSTAAVDVSHWIYKASYACPEALYHRDEESLHKAYKTIINYIDNYVKTLKAYNVELTFVFDGMKLPAKQVTHKERSARKAESRKKVEEELGRGNKSEARKYMLRCIDVKFDIVKQIINYCKRENINYIVAPYEADAQLAFLINSSMCEFIITEDTDLILYGCHKIIYKLDTNGNCVLYNRAKLSKCLGPRGEDVTFEKFRRICILSGCDYLKNIPYVGLQSAKKFFLLTKQDNIELLLPKLATYLKSPKFVGKVTQEYIKGFIDAESTFKHHIVYDPVNKSLRPLEPYPKGFSSSDFPLAGKRFHSSMAEDMARGEIDLDSLNPKEDLDSASDDSENEGANDENDLQERGTNMIGRPTKLKMVV